MRIIWISRGSFLDDDKDFNRDLESTAFIRLNSEDKFEGHFFQNFHEEAGKSYCSYYGLLEDNLQPKKFGGYIALTNILLA